MSVADELAVPAAADLLAHATLARLAYNGADGTPRVVPVGFLWDGTRIATCTATTAPKVRALSARPAVALTIDAGDTPASARALLLRGDATVDIVDGVPEEYLIAARKSMGGEVGEEFEQAARDFYPQMAVIRIEPRWARFFDFGAGRLPPFLQAMVGG